MNENRYFALVPFARNLIQLKEGGRESPNVITVDEYLHYLSDSETKLMDPLNTVMTQYGYASPLPATAKFIEKLAAAGENIITQQSSINETELEIKMTLGLYIRIFLERFLYKKYEAKMGSAPSVPANSLARTRMLFSSATSCDALTQREIAYVNSALVISPSFVHANSFMYEPLIDVNCDRMIQIAKWLKDENDQF